METKKQAMFRVRIIDVKTKKSSMFTVYKNSKKYTLSEFADKLEKKIKEV